ncbi:hypothetical protein Tco_1285790 [Tanacetum coccineum]
MVNTEVRQYLLDSSPHAESNQDTGSSDVASPIEEQVKKEVSKIIPKVEKFVTDQLESEVLVRSSKEANTSHAVAANLSELELKKDLLDNRKPNTLSPDQHSRQLYKALVEHRGPKKTTEKRNPSTSGSSETTTKTAGKTTSTGSKTHKKSASQSAPVGEAMQSTDVFEDLQTRSSKQVSKMNKQKKRSNIFLTGFKNLRDYLLLIMHGILCPAFIDIFQPMLRASGTTDPESPTLSWMKGTCKSLTELEYFCEEVYKATTEKLDWINPEGRQYPHDLRQPLPLVPNSQGRRVIPFHHFINNDLEYLRGGVSSRKYSTSVTKTKAADYGHIKWIEDLVPNSMWESNDCQKYDNTAHWNHTLGAKSEGRKVTNLSVEERIAFNVSLRMFTRRVVIQRRVEDLQLGVESYQKKLNLTKPDTYRSNLRRQDAYIPYSDPEEDFIYEKKTQENRLMAYLPQTFWSQRDQANARAMIQAIDKRLKQEEMQSLEDLSAVRLRFSDPMIQPEPEGSTQGYPLDSVEVLRFNTTAGNPIKKILLKLNLSDHRLCKMCGNFRYSDTTHLSRSVKVLKLKNFKKDATLKLFKNGMSMSVQKSQSQDGKVTRWRRDCAWLMISRCSRSQCQIQVQGTSSIQEVNDHYNIFTRESQEYELKTKDKA